MSWNDLLSEWEAIEQDFQDAAIYGIDLSDRTLDSRTWRWFKVRLFGLLNRPQVFDGISMAWTTRLQRALYGPIAQDGQVSTR